MVAYSFKKQFVPLIRQGYKRQTIRAHSLRRHARVGELIQLYTAMRTAHCARILPDVTCIDVCPVIIQFDDAMRITRIETAEVPVRDLDAFAVRDGFTDIEDMAGFWEDTNGRMARFEGVLIEWAYPGEADVAGVAA
jgi:hypothetical protein